MPPPRFDAVLPERVELERVRVPELAKPPPLKEVLFEMVELETVRVPALRMPLPVFAEFPEMVELVMERVPELLKAPPLPEEFAPVTVTPEILKSAPVSMVKIPKLPLLASIVSEEAPRPVMVRVPAVPAPTTVLASMMFGNAETMVMV